MSTDPETTNGEDKDEGKPVAASSVPEDAEQPNDGGKATNGGDEPDDPEE